MRLYADTALVAGGDATASNVYVASGSTFQAGVVAGLVTGVGLTSWFVEGAYTYRNFPSLEWAALSPVRTIPKNVPRRLNFSGPTLSLGVQIPIGTEAGK